MFIVEYKPKERHYTKKHIQKEYLTVVTVPEYENIIKLTIVSTKLTHVWDNRSSHTIFSSKISNL